MATKYQREEREQAPQHNLDDIPLLREQRRMITPKRKLLVIYGFIILGSFMALIVGKLGEQYPFIGQPELRETAQILDINRDEDAMLLDIPIDTRTTLSIWTPLPADSVSAFQAGDGVGVRFRVSKDNKRIQILETGLVALPLPMQ